MSQNKPHCLSSETLKTRKKLAQKTSVSDSMQPTGTLVHKINQGEQKKNHQSKQECPSYETKEGHR